jgi:hypothetical protein
MDFVEGDNGSCSETSVSFNVDATEEGSIKFEAVYIKEEFPEATSFPPVKTECGVRLWGVCEVVAAHVLGYLLPQQGSCEITLNYFVLCYIMGVVCRLKLGLQS